MGVTRVLVGDLFGSRAQTLVYTVNCVGVMGKGEWGITSLAVPPLGCGQGKLDWHIVGPTLYRHLQGLDIPVELYGPYGTPAAELTPEFLADAEPQRTLFSGADLNKRAAAWLAVVDILYRVETHPYHWPVGRVIFHKILYFATEAGLATGLQFSPGSYGPYSAAAEPLVSKLINNGLIVESKSGRMFRVQVGPSFADARRAYAAQLDASSAIQERVADLFLRVNTHQAEVAATVHYAATHLLSPEAESSETDALLRVMHMEAASPAAMERRGSRRSHTPPQHAGVDQSEREPGSAAAPG